MQKLKLAFLTFVLSLHAQSNTCDSLFVSSEVPLLNINYGSLSDVSNKVSELFDTTLQGCRFGVSFCGQLAIKIPGIAYRVIKFNGSVKEIRNEIFLPLAEHVRKIHDINLAQNEREKAYQNFIIFWPELILKINRAIPVVATKVSVNAMTGLFSTKRSIENDTAAREIALTILKKMWSEMQNNKNDIGETRTLFHRMSLSLNEAVKGTETQILNDLGVSDLITALNDVR